MSSRPAWIVSLEFKRIQTYLFSSPRLRAMLELCTILSVNSLLRCGWEGYLTPDRGAERCGRGHSNRRRDHEAI